MYTLHLLHPDTESSVMLQFYDLSHGKVSMRTIIERRQLDGNTKSAAILLSPDGAEVASAGSEETLSIIRQIRKDS